MAGPYCIIKKVGNTYQLDLSSSIYIHPVFSSDKLQRAATNLLLSQIEDPSPPIKVNREQKWEVEEILAAHLC